MTIHPNPVAPIVLRVLSFLLLISHSSLVAPVVTEANGYHYKNTTHHYYCKIEEREALLRFKHHINDTCGLLTSWGLDHHDDCCQWPGVRCSSRTGHVVGLHLAGTTSTDSDGYAYSDWCLQGKVSPSLVKLKRLRYLDLSCNMFRGHPIPNFLGSLPNLMHLNLSGSDFSGEIPYQLGNFSKLTSLDLSYNNLLPGKSWEWLSRLTLLRYIDLSWVDLNQTTGEFFQAINTLPSLKALHADECHLSPPKVRSLSLSHLNDSSNINNTQLSVLSLSGNNFNDTWILQWLSNLNLSHLLYIDLSDNSISGPIPSYFWNDMPSLSHLNLRYNGLEGSLPTINPNLKHLTLLDLSGNSLRCSLQCVEAFGNLCSLQSLSLADNNLTEELSNIIHDLSGCAHKSLVSLDLSSNLIWGSIPNSIATFSSLEVLRISENQLNGTISQSVSQLTMLNELDLSENSLQGTLSDKHLSNLSKLRRLDVSYNPGLAINISFRWSPPFQLEYIIMDSTKLGPQFPRWLLTQTCYRQLYISNVGINDTFPPSFWNSLPSNLEGLDLSNNQIHGELTIDISSKIFHSNPGIDISSNMIEGRVPSFPINASTLVLSNNRFTDATSLLCPKTKMMISILDLSNNSLSQQLPNCWTNFDQLGVLRLENNKFFGNIPTSIGAMNSLQHLRLSNNSFSGQLPPSLENCTSLLVLDVGYNSLTGSIPQGIGTTFNDLVMLRLRKNHFYGRLPVSLCELPHLQIVDLSSNHFSGTIPTCISNLSAMANAQYVGPPIIYHMDDAAGEKLDETTTLTWKGDEQVFRDNLEFVRSIDVSNNQLEGHIPQGIYALTELVLLDLSSNNLRGDITPEIGKLKSLEYLNVSNNHLCGQIPASLATVSTLEILDVSSNNLSGEIPTGTQLQGFDASKYGGNPLLCGPPLPKCSDNQATENEANNRNQDENGEERYDTTRLGLYISIILGFIVGFWGVCGTLVLKRSCRVTFFNFLDDLKDKVWRKW